MGNVSEAPGAAQAAKADAKQVAENVSDGSKAASTSGAGPAAQTTGGVQQSEKPATTSTEATEIAPADSGKPGK